MPTHAHPSQLGQLVGCRRGSQHVVIAQWITFQCQRFQRHELLIELFTFDKDSFEVALDRAALRRGAPWTWH